MIIKTDRLILRPLKKSDAKDIVEGVGNYEVSKWLLVVKHPYTLKDANSWIANNQKKWSGRKKDRGDYGFGIELKEERRLIGAMGMHHVDRTQGKATIGYWLNPNYWQHGYGSEALSAVIDIAFKKIKLRRLEADVFVGNPSSGKLLEKFGFQLEGKRLAASVCKADGRIVDDLNYGLLRKNYRPPR